MQNEGAGNDIYKKFNKFGIGKAPSVPMLSFFKEFLDIFSPFDEKKMGFRAVHRIAEYAEKSRNSAGFT